MPENEEVQQDMFDSLCIETFTEQAPFFEHSNASGLTRPLPRQAAVSPKSAGNSPQNVQKVTPNRLPKEERQWSVPIPEKDVSLAGETTFRVEGGLSLEGEIPPWLAAAEHSSWPAYHEPIDLTKLLNRCEGDVELLTEVQTAYCSIYLQPP